ncbi:hypothetical protein [Pedobacter sp. UYP1]|uniref:hypothetical protein n=1 Tax=Pedobacter sp. UYP1 TaxID=1756396 RepID=UPI003396D24E
MVNIYNGIVVFPLLPADEKQTETILYDDIIAWRCDQNGHGKYFYNCIAPTDLWRLIVNSVFPYSFSFEKGISFAALADPWRGASNRNALASLVRIFWFKTSLALKECRTVFKPKNATYLR